VRDRVLSLVLLCALVTAFLAFIAIASSPLGEIEEHFEIGRRWRATGTFPPVLRPPGYPAFVALTLLVRDSVRGPAPTPARATSGSARDDDMAAVLAAQGLLLVVASAALFWFASRDQGVVRALGLAALFAVNPYSLILASTLSYCWLHVVLMLLATLALTLATERPDRARLVASGLLWGVATLVRPVSLILPAFVAVLPLTRGGAGRDWKSVAGFTGWFSLGMALAIAPVTVRNFAAAHRVVPVNAQAGFALWGNTIERIPSPPGYLTWSVLWTEHGRPVARRVTGSDSPPESVEGTVRLNDELMRLALRHIREDPSTYLANVLVNFRQFNLDRMGEWLTFFQRAQLGGPIGDVPDRPLGLGARWGGAAAQVTLTAMMALALVGVAAGAWRRHPAASTIAVIYAAMVVAQSIVFLSPRYPYVKLPLAVLGTGAALSTPGLPAWVAAAVGAALLVAGLGSSLALVS